MSNRSKDQTEHTNIFCWTIYDCPFRWRLEQPIFLHKLNHTHSIPSPVCFMRP